MIVKVISIFNDITDAIYIRIVLVLASGLLAVLSVISPRMWGVCIKEMEKKIGD